MNRMWMNFFSFVCNFSSCMEMRKSAGEPSLSLVVCGEGNVAPHMTDLNLKQITFYTELDKAYK